MNNYSIYCTVEQAKKALELGAPINKTHANPSSNFEEKYPKCIWVSLDDKYLDVGYVLAIPTTEQMIGWLEEQGVFLEMRHTDEKKLHIWVGALYQER